MNLVFNLKAVIYSITQRIKHKQNNPITAKKLAEIIKPSTVPVE